MTSGSGKYLAFLVPIFEDKIAHRLGVFRGATLDTGHFDFKPDDGAAISGEIGEALTEEQAAAMHLLTNRGCEATLNQTTLTPPSGRPREKFELLNLKPVT